MAQKYFGTNIPVAAGFDLAAQRPLDAREVVAKYTDLETIPDIQKFAGLRVYVEEQKKFYFWNGSAWKEEVSQGATGPSGTDGATWLSGTEVPLSQGKDGDFYLNTRNYDVYKKESGKWTKIGNIKGATGQAGATGKAGADGATWLFGTAAPTGQGKDGDFYLNTSTFDVYHKASGSWSKTGNIKGATGTRGSQWLSGTSITGTNATGTVFSDSGIASALVNDMYLNTSTGAVYKCTTAGNASTAKWSYVGSIKGTPGGTGATGTPGTDGATWLFGTAAPTGQGKDGDFYLNTSTFDVYNKASGSWSKKGNIKGATGATGTPGKDGTNGTPGTDGKDGATWLFGTGAPNSQGKTGDFYLETSTFDIYSKATGSWVKSGNIKGTKGDKGDRGETGEGFSIYKTYASVSAMNADKANVAQGKFVLIASNVEDADNAKLYVKGVSDFTFLTDLSGAQGIKGEKGEKGNPGQDGATGPAGKDGDNVRVGTEYSTAKQVKLFFKVVE
jgi:hypothetical protein